MSDARLARYYGWFTFCIWLLIALGGGVRAMDAGLSCPDWPLCFGDVIPDFHIQVYFEFIHRVIAGLIGIANVVLAVFIFKRPASGWGLKSAAVLSLVLYLAQAVLGGLTVLWHLHEGVVAAHLTMGTTFFGLNLWTHLSLKRSATQEILPRTGTVTTAFAAVSWFAVAVIAAQIILGGLVASHYAALVCTDFPLCHGKWIPTLSGIIGLHVMHRLGAYFTTFVVLALFIWARGSGNNIVRNRAAWMAAVVLIQVCIGIANILFLTPPLITVLHLATGVALFGLALGTAFEAQASAVPSARLSAHTPSPELG